MYRFVTLFVSFMLLIETITSLSISRVKGQEIQDLKRCMNMGSYGEECCKYEIDEQSKKSYDECLKKTHSIESCDFHVCYGKAEGFLRPNGTFDKIALEELLDQDFKNETNVSDVLKAKCLNEDLDAYIQEDPCYLKELGNCLGFYAMLSCKNWNESDECKKVKTELEKCQKILP